MTVAACLRALAILVRFPFSLLFDMQECSALRSRSGPPEVDAVLANCGKTARWDQSRGNIATMGRRCAQANGMGGGG
jgi:hypothetical protein